MSPIIYIHLYQYGLMLSYFIQLESIAVIIYFGLKLSQINRSPFKLVSSFWDIPTCSLSTS